MELVLVDILTGIPQNFLQQSIVLRITNTPHSKIKSLIASVIFVVLNAAIYPYLHLSAYFYIGVCIFAYSLIYWLFHRIPIHKSILMGMGQLILIQSVEFIFQLALTSLRNYFEYSSDSIAHNIIIRLVCLLFLLLLYGIFSKPISIANMELSKFGHLLISFIFVILIATPLIWQTETRQKTPALPDTINISSIFVVIAFFVYNTAYLYFMRKSVAIENKLETEQIYSENLNRSLSEISSFKHEYANMVNSIHSLVQNEEWDALKTYMGKLSVDLIQINNIDILNQYLKKYPILYSIVQIKMALSELKGVKFRVMVQNQINLYYCDPVDLSRMIGILLDNAIEEAMITDDKKVELEITHYRNRNRISVRNSCAGSVDTELIYQRGFTTKELHSGIGLNTVQSIIKKYRDKGLDMALKSEYDENTFTQILTE